MIKALLRLGTSKKQIEGSFGEVCLLEARDLSKKEVLT